MSLVECGHCGHFLLCGARNCSAGLSCVVARSFVVILWEPCAERVKSGHYVVTPSTPLLARLESEASVERFCEGTEMQCWNALRRYHEFVILLLGLEAFVLNLSAEKPIRQCGTSSQIECGHHEQFLFCGVIKFLQRSSVWLLLTGSLRKRGDLSLVSVVENHVTTAKQSWYGRVEPCGHARTRFNIDAANLIALDNLQTNFRVPKSIWCCR